MKKIEWSNRLNLGVKQIDNQHKRLVQLVNNLGAALDSGMGEDILDTLLAELWEYTEFHFRDEEILMLDVGFPSIQAHVKAHDKLKEQVQEYQQQRQNGEAVSPRELLDFLGRWLVDHIIHTDTQIAKYIKQSQASKG